jgi:excinuclease UvrABC ATPase subunit
MTGSKDHTDVSTTNIIKPTMEALPADDQQPFDDLIRREKEEVLWQLTERRDKVEEEVLRQLKERLENVTEKYLSYFTMDRHQKIIHQGEIDMTSLLPRLRLPL